MKRLHISFALVGLVACIATGAAQTSAKPAGDASALRVRTAGLERHDGFFPYYWDEKKADILFELPDWAAASVRSRPSPTGVPLDPAQCAAFGESGCAYW